MAADICRVDNRMCVCPDMPQTETESVISGGVKLYFSALGKLENCKSRSAKK